MRTITLNNTTISAPDSLVWENDNNYIAFSATSAVTSISAKVMLHSDTSIAVECVSDTRNIVINLREFLLANVAYNTATTLDILVTEVGGTNGTTDISLKMLRGRTLPSRHHGSATVLCVPRLYASNPTYEIVDVWSPSSWWRASRASGEISLAEGRNQVEIPYNTNTLVAFPTTTASESDYGEIWDEHHAVRSVGITYKLVGVSCMPKNGIILRYWDTDGCRRYAVGTVLSDTMSADHTIYGVSESVVNMSPAHHIDKAKESLKVGFENIDAAQYLEDIMLSEEVEIVKGGNGVYTKVAAVVPTTMSMERDGETKDIVITFDIL